MNPNDSKLDFERRWALPAGILSVLGVALIAISYVYAGSNIPAGDGVGEYLQAVDGHRSELVFANLIQALGYALLVAPLVFLFKAAAARAGQIKAGLIGVIIVAPIFLGAASISNAVSNLDAATKYKSDGVALVQKCVDEKKADSADLTAEELQDECTDEVGSDLQREASTSGLTVGFGLAGAIGFTVAVVYVALWGMRTGLISRFWGSLGMALGAVSILFPQFTLLWFIYAGLLIAGWIPGGRPPAWEAGVAIPWPRPGEELAKEVEDDVVEGSAEEIGFEEPTLDAGELGDGDQPQVERKKRS